MTINIKLRQFEISDAPAVLNFLKNDIVSRFTHDDMYIISIFDAEKVISDIWQSEYQKHGYSRYAVVIMPSEEVVGFCGPKAIDDQYSVADMGYRLLPNYWGLGVATQAVKKAIEKSKVFELKTLIANVDSRNIGSKKVLSRNNFELNHVEIKESYNLEHYILNLGN